MDFITHLIDNKSQPVAAPSAYMDEPLSNSDHKTKAKVVGFQLYEAGRYIEIMSRSRVGSRDQPVNGVSGSRSCSEISTLLRDLTNEMV